MHLRFPSSPRHPAGRSRSAPGHLFNMFLLKLDGKKFERRLNMVEHLCEPDLMEIWNMFLSQRVPLPKKV